MIKCAKQKVYSPRQMDVRVTYANEILFLSKFHHLSAPSSTCIHILRNVNFEFTWKYSSETLIKWTRWTGPGLGQTKHLAPKQTSVLWIYSTTCSRKHSIAYSNMYTFHAHAHHRCFSELFGFFRCEKLAKRVRNTYKSHQNMDVRINSDKPWTWEFIPKQFYCDVLLLLIFFFLCNRYFCRECFSASPPPMWMWMLIRILFLRIFLSQSLVSIQFRLLFSFIFFLAPSSHRHEEARTIIHAAQSLCVVYIHTLLRLLSICLPFYFMD